MKTELEVRLKFADPAKALTLLESKGSLEDSYEVVDVYFQPAQEEWGFEDKNMRLRHIFQGRESGKTLFLYRELSWENGVKTHTVHWKYELKDSLQKAEEVIKGWGMREIFRYKKVGKAFKVGETMVFYEDIEHVGVLVEVEAGNQDQLENFISETFEGVSYEKVAKSVASVVKESI